MSKALSVKKGEKKALVYVIFCANVCFVYGGRGKNIGKPSMKWKKYDSDGE